MLAKSWPLNFPASVRLSYLETAIRTVLLTYITALPFKPLLVVERTAFLVLLGLIVLWCLIHRKLFYLPTPFDTPLLLFVLWVGFTIPFATFPEYSLKEYGKLLQWMVVFYSVIYFLGERPYRLAVLSLLGLAAFVVTMRGLAQFNPTNPQAVTGFFPSEVWLTTFLIMMLPFGIAAGFEEGPPVSKWFGVTFSVLATGCLIGTQSRAGLVAFAAELLAVAGVVRSKIAKTTVGVITIGLLVAVPVGLYMKSLSEPGDTLSSSVPLKTGVATIVHRFDIWKFTLSEIPQHWLVGIGYGGQTYLLRYGEEGEIVEPGHTSVKDRGTHNILLYLSLHVGLMGLVLFLWFYASALRITAREYGRALDQESRTILAGMMGCLVGLFVRLQFDQMFVGSLAILFWVFLAVGVVHYPSFVRNKGEGALS